MSAATVVVRHPRGLSFTRQFGASPERVFATFSDPALLARWWGPPECPVVECSIDFRPGGIWHYRLGSGGTVDNWSRAKYEEIEAAHRLVFIETSSDAEGRITSERPPARTAVTFTPRSGGTLLAIDVEYDSAIERDRALARGVETGQSLALDQLSALLAEPDLSRRAWNERNCPMTAIRSLDGALIDFEVRGTGPAVVLVDGAMCTRDAGPMSALAAHLDATLGVILYDRRGRGRSGDAAEYAIDREIEDLRVVIEGSGGSAAVFGMSSGGALAALAAAALPRHVTRLAVFEPPYMPEAARDGALSYTQELGDAVAAGDRDAAVTAFLTRVGTPGNAIASMKESPAWSAMTAMAPTLAYDDAVMTGSSVPSAMATVAVPTLSLAGGDSPAFLRWGAQELARAIPTAKFADIPGQTHAVELDALAAHLLPFLIE